MGGVFAVGLIVIVSVVGYWHSLIKNYTSTQAQPLPALEVFDADLEHLTSRWTSWVTDVATDNAVPPFKASADDLNLLVGKNPALKDHLRIVITNNQVCGQFSFPLDQTKKRELKGRFLNGQGRLNLDFQGGDLIVTVAELKANGKPIPGWIFKKLQKKTGNLAKDLQKNHDVVAFMKKLDTLEVRDNEVVITPMLTN